jgi:hypothetical protein
LTDIHAAKAAPAVDENLIFRIDLKNYITGLTGLIRFTRF